MKHLVSFLLCLSCVVNARAFDETRARQILNTIASDEFEGRRPGFPGGVKTENYLAENFRVCGVATGATAGYFQDVPMLITEEQSAALTLMDHELGKIPFVLGADFTVVTHSGSGSFIAPVVVVGNGYVRPDKDRNDYGDADVSGKIVLIVRGTPDSPYDFQEDFSRRHTLTWAKVHHASAVLYYQDPQVINGAAIPADIYDPQLPILYIGERVLKLLLDGTGYTPETYKAKIKRAPLPLATNKNLYISTHVRELAKKNARNVLGIVYGTDPVLKNEIVVVGAHWDHIGKNASGIIYNGADDNGSGSALVAELAQALAAAPLKRSVLLAHFCGEEDGLLGSDYFVNHPSIPFGNIVGMINLDCEGLGNGTVVMAGGETFGATWQEYKAALDSSALTLLVFGREEGHSGSDHASFARAGCPVLAFWSRGDHPFYHSYDDDARWISDSVMATVGNRAEDFIRFLGNHDGPLAFHGDSLRILARMAVQMDLTGFHLEAQPSVPTSHDLSIAWLSRDAATLTAEIVHRTSEFQFACTAQDVAIGKPKDMLTKYCHQQQALCLGLDEADMVMKRPAEVASLIRQGFSFIRLTAAASPAGQAPPAVFDEARKAGALALVPLDYNTPARLTYWSSQGILTTTLMDFASSPPSVRDGLLHSNALLFLEVTQPPTREQIDTFRAARARRVHLSCTTTSLAQREETLRAVIKTLFDAGLSRDDILLLTGGNLRRFLDS
jgi:aminopeptidase YwaD